MRRLVHATARSRAPALPAPVDDAQERQRRLSHAFDRGQPERPPVTANALRWVMNGATAALLWYVLFRLAQIALGAA